MYIDVLNVPRLESVFLHQRRKTIERGLDRRSDAPLLDIGADDLVTLAELLDQGLTPRLGRIGVEEISLAAEHVVRGLESRFHHGSRRDAILRRLAGIDESLLDVTAVIH